MMEKSRRMATCRPDSTWEKYMTDRAELASFLFAHLLRLAYGECECEWDVSRCCQRHVICVA